MLDVHEDSPVVVLPVAGAPVADLVRRMRAAGIRVAVDERPERLAVRLRDAGRRRAVLVSAAWRAEGLVAVHSAEGRRMLAVDEAIRWLQR